MGASAVSVKTEADAPAAVLSVRDLTVRFGGVLALDGVSFDVPEGRICSLIGPNGAGKTTLFNCIYQIYKAERGEMLLAGQRLTGKSVHNLASLGVSRTFQNLALFPSLNVLRNVMVGMHSRARANFLTSVIPLVAVSREERRLRDEAMAILDTLELTHLANSSVSGLPYPTLKRIELARALANRPRLLLLDEPAGGLTHEELGRLGDLIRKIRLDYKLTILLVEHHIGLVMSISELIVVLDTGRLIAIGTPNEVQQNSRVIESYLGTANAGPA